MTEKHKIEEIVNHALEHGFDFGKGYPFLQISNFEDPYRPKDFPTIFITFERKGGNPFTYGFSLRDIIHRHDFIEAVVGKWDEDDRTHMNVWEITELERFQYELQKIILMPTYEEQIDYLYKYTKE